MNHFFALALPATVHPFLIGMVEEWRRILPPDLSPRWYGVEDCHITLKFLGDLPLTRQEELIEAAAPISAAVNPFEVQLAPCGGFPDLRRPFVLWAGVQLTPPLIQLAGDIDDLMAARGVPAERRPYVPHITLARCRPGRRAEAIPVPEEYEQAFPNFQVTSFALMQTLPSGGRPNAEKRRYNTVHTFPFSHPH